MGFGSRGRKFAAKNVPCSMRASFSLFAMTVFWAGFAPFFVGCGSPKQEIVAQKVAEAIGKFREKKALECRATLLQEAEKIVDSLLLAEAQSTVGDSLSHLKPARPAKPAPIPPIDSLQVKPIFE